MSMQDPISDLLTRIRNGQMAKKSFVTLSNSIKKIKILDVLKSEGYIKGYSVNMNNLNKNNLEIYLKYHKNKPVISKIKRVSRPGLRIYKKSNDLPFVLGGLGIAIISTSLGVVSDKKARMLNQGGEILCIVE
ncbi:MAG: 30S ribosomal protein S8 [Candidatus Azosocius agrarius]|nr:MAG: 30S ribosomal protein S8 [Gammaproteobacteria bacterium]